MSRLPFLLPFPILAGLAVPALAQPYGARQLLTAATPGLQLQGALSPGIQCRAAVRAAERASSIPEHLLAAISRVESGRRDPQTGGWNPWPWTINAEGQGFFYDTKAQAVAAVRALQAKGVQSIDVGCMQINLMHHPKAFASLEEAFDPMANAAYGARFLAQLYGQTGTWEKAAAYYHSVTPGLADEYQKRVLAVWPEEKDAQGRAAGRGAPLAPAFSARTQLATAWASTITPTATTRVAAYVPPSTAENIRIIPLHSGGG
ncbi:MAG: lytic transglycosylase domain-containing protein, partial [Acetobacteraceae bacterium]|nr:lytic transglycosylase domain-containing protein [Acetobacteraceae bacterium]